MPSNSPMVPRGPISPQKKIDTIGMRGIGGVGELDLKLRYLVTLRDQVGAHAGFPAVFRPPVRAGSDEARLGDAGAIVGDGEPVEKLLVGRAAHVEGGVRDGEPVAKRRLAEALGNRLPKGGDVHAVAQRIVVA